MCRRAELSSDDSNTHGALSWISIKNKLTLPVWTLNSRMTMHQLLDRMPHSARGCSRPFRPKPSANPDRKPSLLIASYRSPCLPTPCPVTQAPRLLSHWGGWSKSRRIPLSLTRLILCIPIYPSSAQIEHTIYTFMEYARLVQFCVHSSYNNC